MSLRGDLIVGAAIAAAAAGGLTAIYWNGRLKGAELERPKTAMAQAQAAGEGAQAAAGRDALALADAGQMRAQTIIIREGAHRDTILAAPGAGAPLDPGLVDAARRGLCDSDAYRGDPGCAVFAAGPDQLPGGGEAGSAAAP